MKPLLSLSRATLVPTTTADLDRVCHLLWDRDVRRYLCDDEELPRDLIAGFLVRSDALEPRHIGLWRIETAADGFVGLCGLTPVADWMEKYPLMAGGVEPVVALYSKVWGRGIAREALAALVRHAATGCGLARLVGCVDAPNEASRRMMMRCGFVETGSGQAPKYPAIFYERILTVRATAT